MLLVRSQDTPRDRERLSALAAVVAEAGWPLSSVVGMADAERELGHSGLWTYTPWIFQLEQQAQRARRRLAGGQRWLVFLEPATMVDPGTLSELLGGYDAREQVYLGHELRDQSSSIIHHYSQGPPFPHAHAGFAISGALALRLARELREKPLGGNQQIEPVWELAKWIKDLGVGLTDRRDALCTARGAGCATWVSQSPRASWRLQPSDVVIGVKAVAKFHAARIPLVHQFWGAGSSAEVLYLSNAAFDGAPATARVVDLAPEFGELVDPARESTKDGSGHCSKMEAILKYFSRHRPRKRWYVVTDDDTLLNVPRLLEVLSSHDDRQAVYLGERYGWAHTEDRPGTNYITTGAGMALSGVALSKLAACSSCTCSRPNAPDDMVLGTWLKTLGVTPVHEEGFHQAEPHNYHPEVLAHAEAAVSFHRFGLQLPATAPEAERAAARRQHWRQWVKEHFQPHGGGGGGGSSAEL